MQKKVKGFKRNKARSKARHKKLQKKGYFGKKKSGKNRSVKSARKARKSRRSSSGGSSKSLTSQITSYKDDAIGGAGFGAASRTKLFDLVKLSPNPSGREFVGAVMAHGVSMLATGDARKVASDIAKAGVAVTAFLLTKESDVAGKIAETVDGALPEQPFNDNFLIE